MNYKGAKKYILERLRNELDKKYTYHGIHHTMDVWRIVVSLCKSEKISKRETILLKTAALYHDAGFMSIYKGHEEKGCELVSQILPDFGYSKEDIELIKGMIMATKIPQSPSNKLEEIICDADLDYLGRDDFESIAATLFLELQNCEMVTDIDVWNHIQVNFIGAHQYFTQTNKLSRESKKQEHLAELKLLLK